jgi:glycosyltransferase involved in cell wall biosynthesis
VITAIVGDERRIQTAQGAYVNPTTWKSLDQWWRLFPKVRLLLPTCHQSEPPPGWIRLPDFIESDESYSLDGHVGYFRRWRTVTSNAPRFLEDVGLLYLRMPSLVAHYIYKAARKRKIPVFTEFHGDWAEGALAETDGSFWRRITRKHRARIGDRVYRELAAKSLAIVTIGPVLAEKYVPHNKPLLISTNHSVDEPDIRQRDHFALNNPPRILFVGGLENRKGLRYLFDGLAILKSSGQNFEFVAVGQGPNRGFLEEYAGQLGIFERVRFAGVVPLGPALWDEYRQADIFVLPSVAAEGVPRVIQEAAAMGCPVIATDIGSTRWQLRDGAGIVVPPCNPQALADAMRQVLSDEPLRRSLSERGYLIAREYSYENQRSRIARFVQSTLPQRFLASQEQP